MPLQTPSQIRSLKRLVQAAARYVPLYQELWRRHGVNVDRLRLPEELDHLPVVSKSMLLTFDVTQRLDRRYRHRKLIKTGTSGSTGQPLQLWIDSASARRRQLRFLRALWSVGYRPGQRLMLISSRASHAIKRVSPWARFIRWTYADLFLGAGELVDLLDRTRPDVLYGPLALLVLLAQEGGARHRPAVVISTSEQLTPSVRRLIKSSFAVEVTDFYGMTEVGLVAWQPRNAAPYHTAAGAFVLEFLPVDDARSGDSSGLERLVVTDLRGGSMPLIRYDTGDLVRRDLTQPGAPIIEFAGKQYDFLWLPDGRRISPYRVDNALGDLPGVLQYQLIQQPDFSMDLRLATTDPAIVQQAESRLRELCGELLTIRTEEIRVAHSLSTHKLRPVQSFVSSAGNERIPSDS